MECLTIGSSEDLTFIQESIVENLPSDTIHSITVSGIPRANDKMRFLDIRFSCNDRFPKGLNTMLAKMITQKYESRILRQIIMSNYGYFSKQEQAKIFRIALDNRKVLDSASDEIQLIESRLSEYLATSDKLYLDGFVRFRLRDYWKLLERSVEEGVDEFLLQREYDDFIELLQLFVELQTPQFELFNIISDGTGKYIFTDEYGTDITHKCTTEFIVDLASGEITYADMLLSVLIILAPQKIVWHNSEHEPNKELIKTSQSVFGDRLTVCDGCTICKK